ncbi:hypothetical protein ACWGJ2_20390 [Streptomyces sp. NPDC054796]
MNEQERSKPEKTATPRGGFGRQVAAGLVSRAVWWFLLVLFSGDE